MLRKRKRFSESDGDEDPMSGISNLSDAMLVLALGFLIFAIWPRHKSLRHSMQLLK